MSPSRLPGLERAWERYALTLDTHLNVVIQELSLTSKTFCEDMH